MLELYKVVIAYRKIKCIRMRIIFLFKIRYKFFRPPKCYPKHVAGNILMRVSLVL
jgi:hypothetical protein